MRIKLKLAFTSLGRHKEFEILGRSVTFNGMILPLYKTTVPCPGCQWTVQFTDNSYTLFYAQPQDTASRSSHPAIVKVPSKRYITLTFRNPLGTQEDHVTLGGVEGLLEPRKLRYLLFTSECKVVLTSLFIKKRHLPRQKLT